MAVAERRAKVSWQGDLRAGSGEIQPGSGAFGPLPVVFPARLESDSGTTSPEELIAAAHATCYAMSLTGTLYSNGQQPESVEVTAICRLDRTEAGLKIEGIELQASARLPGATEDEFKSLAQKAEERCPVSNALRPGVPIRLEAKLAT